MTYAERFFIMAVALIADSFPDEMGRLCGPLANGEFSVALEPSFLNGSIQDRLDEIEEMAAGLEAPSWYTNAIGRINSRLGVDTKSEE